MSEPATATANPAVSQLARYWMTLDDATKLIFNQIYREASEVVLRVLTQGQLQPDPTHTSIDQIVAGVSDEAAINQAGVTVMDVKVTPEYPQPKEKFTVSWRRSVSGGIPNHTDAVQIVNKDGAVVDERPVAQEPAQHGASDEHSVEIAEGLPLGEYTVNVWANLEGNDGTGVPTAQGMRGQGGAVLYVGNTANVQAVQQSPAANAAMGGVADAAYAAGQIADETDLNIPVDNFDAMFRQGLQKAAESLMQIESLADGFQSELQRIIGQLNNRINWAPERQDGTVSAVQQRLQGMQSIVAAENPGDLAIAVIQVVGDLY